MDLVVDFPIHGPSLIDEVDGSPSPSLAQYSISLLQQLFLLYRSAVRHSPVISSTTIFHFRIPSLPHSPSTFGALLLNYMVTALTISAHHLYLPGDISRADPLAFCQPVPKTQLHRDPLIKAV